MKMYSGVLVLVGFASVVRADLLETDSGTKSFIKREGTPSLRPRTSPQKKQHPQAPPSPKAEAIHFESENLQWLKDRGIVELKKNVLVTRGRVKITSDEAKILLKGDKQNIEQIFAKGNVRFLQWNQNPEEQITAKGDESEYSADTDILVLKGHAELTKNSDVIRGQHIEYNLAQGVVGGEGIKGQLHSTAKE